MREITAKVVSVKTKGTAIVELVRLVAHPKYGKRVKRTTRIAAHDEFGAKPGEIVKLLKSKPVSKTKHHTIVEVVT